MMSYEPSTGILTDGRTITNQSTNNNFLQPLFLYSNEISRTHSISKGSSVNLQLKSFCVWQGAGLLQRSNGEPCT